MLTKEKSTNKKSKGQETQQEKTVKYFLVGLFSLIVLFLLYMVISLWVTPQGVEFTIN